MTLFWAAAFLALAPAFGAPLEKVDLAPCQYVVPGFLASLRGATTEIRCPPFAPVFNFLVSREISPLPQWTRADPDERAQALERARAKVIREWNTLTVRQQHDRYNLVAAEAHRQHTAMLELEKKLEEFDPKHSGGKLDLLTVPNLVGFAVLGGPELGEHYVSVRKSLEDVYVGKWGQPISVDSRSLAEVLEAAKQDAAALEQGGRR